MDDPKRRGPTSRERAGPEAPRDARVDPLVGRLISGRYRIESLLAVGGMGAVYLGWHRHLKKRVAVKVLRPDTEKLPELVARFRREAIAGAHVSHVNVAAATDFGQLPDGSYFLVLEYVAGRTLHDVILDDGPLPYLRAVPVIRQIAEALAAIHAIGIVHRDLKPRNVMLVGGPDEIAKLIDLGFAKVPVDQVVDLAEANATAAEQSGEPVYSKTEDTLPRMRLESLREDVPSLTGVGTIVGTVSYIAPESVNGMDAVDERSDLYALGLLAYQILAGKHPFDAVDDAEMFSRQRFTAAPPFKERAPEVGVPSSVEAIVLRLLEKDPKDRFASATSLIEALDAVVAPKGRPRVRLWPRAIALAGSAAALGVLGAGLFFAQRTPALTFGAAPVESAEARPPSADLALAASSAVPTASASALPVVAIPTSPPASDASATTGVDAGDSARAALARGLRVHDLRAAELAFTDLAEHEPDAFREPELALASRELTAELDLDGKADHIFELLSSRLGAVGLDLLYDLVATRGLASAAVRAGNLLRRPHALDGATPALKIAFELREASCVDKQKLLDRAVTEGDARALVVLETQGLACFKKNNRQILDASAQLRARLRRAP